MSLRRWTIFDIFTILGFGVISFFLFRTLIPNIEASRSEVQLATAYNQVRQFQLDYQDASSGELPEIDPWGQPYHLIPLDAQRVRVLSSGSNMTFSPSGLDDDDIYSDMPNSPMEPTYARKRREFHIALLVAIGSWTLLTAIYIRSRKGVEG